ncbi:protein disulfide isomerase [Choiromyces venosus 120613-1]|uniref:Protein disulfide-isomerase n=1 Tax=Choiromyces venosus 120613-1 TaxID=1336337 RepID=A0A3N4JQL4_9PEZI|nr:protein disulfide isomerase [Choiromyces venosus 120613-1]
MKHFKELTTAVLTLLATVAYAQDGEAPSGPSDVNVLGKDTFDSFVKEHPLVLAEFYAPWCGHCKALAPEYEDAATKLKEKDIPLAKVDCTVEAELCEKNGVQGYPTLKIFRGPENSSPYAGQRKSDAIVSYMTKQALPAVSLLDKDTIAEFKTADKIVVIAYLSPDDKEKNATFTSVAEKLRDSFLFGATSDSALAEADSVKAPAIVLYKTFDEGKTVFDGEFTAEEITNFATVASTPLMGEVGPETYSGYMAAGLPLAYIFVDGEEIKEKLTAAIRPIAEKYKGKINFATIDAVAYGAHANNLNLETKWPAFAIQDTTKNLKYPFDQEKEITETSISEFVDAFVAGKIDPSIKSEPIPETQEGPVHVVVANNYEELVMDNDKDVLLEFYAPWCGHCKNLAPKYEELAALYFNNPEYKDKVIVAKVDATANDVPVEIQGFPTIKMYAAGAKDLPIDYAGSRTVEDLATFIKTNGKYKVDAYVAPPPEPETEEETEEPKAEKSAEETPVGSAATAATETVKEAVKKATEAAQAVVGDDDYVRNSLPEEL